MAMYPEQLMPDTVKELHLPFSFPQVSALSVRFTATILANRLKIHREFIDTRYGVPSW